MSDAATVSISMPRVHTLQVTVRALRIGTKQVTQSVFRQLPRRRVWDTTTGTLRGQPWGTVNYFWGDCASGSTHLHVVWQQGERLFRDCVYDPREHVPAGVWESEQRIRGLEGDLQTGALFVLALSVWREGVGLTPLDPPGAVFQVIWPCGVPTRLTPPRLYDQGNSTLANALAQVYLERRPDKMEYRETQHETSKEDVCPPGKGWEDMHLRYPPSTRIVVGYRWSRSKQETEAQWAKRYRDKLTKTYDALASELIDTCALWDAYELPQSFDAAREMINETAEQWRLECQALDRLRQQFLTVYAQLTDLDQLFIAV